MSNRNSAPLEARGHRKHKLMRELAKQDRSVSDLARAYGVSHTAIRSFRIRHEDEIAAIAQNINDKFEGIWIAEKSARLQEYAQDVEDINEDLQKVQREDKPQFLRVKHNALKNAAEEMGDLPARVNVGVQVAQVTYVVDGVDMDELR